MYTFTVVCVHSELTITGNCLMSIYCYATCRKSDNHCTSNVDEQSDNRRQIGTWSNWSHWYRTHSGRLILHLHIAGKWYGAKAGHQEFHYSMSTEYSTATACASGQHTKHTDTDQHCLNLHFRPADQTTTGLHDPSLLLSDEVWLISWLTCSASVALVLSHGSLQGLGWLGYAPSGTRPVRTDL